MCACLAVTGGLAFGYSNGTSSKAAGEAMIAFICLFIVNFAYGWGPVGWILPSEIFPIQVRAKGIAIASMSNWLGM